MGFLYPLLGIIGILLGVVATVAWGRSHQTDNE